MLVYSSILFPVYIGGSEKVHSSTNANKAHYLHIKVDSPMVHLPTLTLAWRQATVLILMTLCGSMTSCDGVRYHNFRNALVNDQRSRGAARKPRAPDEKLIMCSAIRAHYEPKLAFKNILKLLSQGADTLSSAFPSHLGAWPYLM